MTALQRLAQLAEWATYPFLLLSGILILAMPMDLNGNWRQLVTDPTPTEDQYHPPWESEYAISDIATLEPVAPDVLTAANDAKCSTFGYWDILSVAASPWFVYSMLRSLRSRLDRSAAANSPATVSPA